MPRHLWNTSAGLGLDGIHHKNEHVTYKHIQRGISDGDGEEDEGVENERNANEKEK